jgi:hypothetical protein
VVPVGGDGVDAALTGPVVALATRTEAGESFDGQVVAHPLGCGDGPGRTPATRGGAGGPQRAAELELVDGLGRLEEPMQPRLHVFGGEGLVVDRHPYTAIAVPEPSSCSAR